MHQLDPRPAGVMAHKFSSPGAGTCQTSGVHYGLMFFIHLPSPHSHHSGPISLCVCVCMAPPPPSHPPLPLSMQPAILKTIFVLINHANTLEQLWVFQVHSQSLCSNQCCWGESSENVNIFQSAKKVLEAQVAPNKVSRGCKRPKKPQTPATFSSYALLFLLAGVGGGQGL